MSDRALTDRQTNLLVTACSIVAADAARGDNGTFGWFNRTLKGTRTPEPATEAELQELWKILNGSATIKVECFHRWSEWDYTSNPAGTRTCLKCGERSFG